MRLAETSAPPKPLSRGSAGAQGARPRRHAARHETLRHGDMGRWFTSFRLYAALRWWLLMPAVSMYRGTPGLALSASTARVSLD
jgi:hypothetical protein